jgi:sugar/nucleoside kinase (ribokinase family)
VTETRLDVLAIGDAIVDVIATTDDAFLVAEGLPKGSMRLIDPAEATRLYGLMGQARETSGGSAANTMAGVAALGGRAGFVGQVAKDQLGEIFAHDIRALGVDYRTPPREGDLPTGRCLILVTPDGQRTMNTSPGASHSLTAASLDEEQIREAAILYLEAYLWVPDAPRAAMERAIEIAHSAGRKVAFTLSDIACIARRRDSFLDLIGAGAVDLLFANENEVQALAGEEDFDRAIDALKDKVPLLVCTCSKRGRSRSTGEYASMCRRLRSTRSSTPPAPAICSRRASSPGSRKAAASATACAWGRSPRPRSSPTSARVPKPI